MFETPISDHQLLKRFTQDASEDAFGEIVCRHSGMVYSACCRFLGDAHLAEDAAQAVFMVLARKAGSIREKTVLSDWLHKTAHYVCLHLKRENARRNKREQKATEAMLAVNCSRADQSPEICFDEIRPFVDEEVRSLPAASRQAIILHYLEGKNLQETAVALNCSPDAVRMRLNYGVDKLRKKLAKRGITVTVLTLTAFLAANTAEAAPAALATTIHAAAMNWAGGLTAGTGPGTVTASQPVSTMAEAALRMMWWAKVKSVILGIALVGAVMVGGATIVKYATSMPSRYTTQRQRNTGLPQPNPAGLRESQEVAPRPSAGTKTPSALVTGLAEQNQKVKTVPSSNKSRHTGPATKLQSSLTRNVTSGVLRFSDQTGAVAECPLKATEVKASISGFLTRVTVTQTFRNPLAERIEAVYVFPLPNKAAVDAMCFTVGTRRIIGVIQRRKEARAIYARAVRAGKKAALLEQERPNIFTQSLANIDPGQTIKVEISYIDTLEYDNGGYEWHFPMRVAPRYVPAQGKGIPYLPSAITGAPMVRNGRDISLDLTLDAGVPIRDLKVASHRTTIKRSGDSRARIVLQSADNIPNKDFVLRYKVAGQKPQVGVLSHTGPSGQGYFMLMIQPCIETGESRSPRELMFLIDASGSMNGTSIDTVRESVTAALGLCRQKDTVQIITFSDQPAKLFDQPMPATRENLDRALEFTRNIKASGGTEMLGGVRQALATKVDRKRVRIVVMFTDGQISNESEIIQEVKSRCGDAIRFWCIGVGTSPNRHLIDGVARQGGGMAKHLGIDDDPRALAGNIMDRIHRAELTNIQIDWGDAEVFETYPSSIPDLWQGQPVIVYGQYEEGVSTTITVHAASEGEEVEIPLQVNFPKDEEQNDVLAKVWARKKIEDLMHLTAYAGSPQVREAVTRIAMNYELMSQYTSFVAVDEFELKRAKRTFNPPRKLVVPIPWPVGVEWESVAVLTDSDTKGSRVWANQYADKKIRQERIRRLLMSAQFYLQHKEYDKARSMAEAVLSMDPCNPDAMKLRVKALKAYRKAAKNNAAKMSDSEVNWTLDVSDKAGLPSSELVYPEDWEKIKRKVTARKKYQERRRVLEEIEERAIPAVLPEYLVKPPDDWNMGRREKRRAKLTDMRSADMGADEWNVDRQAPSFSRGEKSNVSSLKAELARMKAKVAAMESQEMAPATGGDAQTLTEMKQKGAITIGGDVAVDFIIRDRQTSKPPKDTVQSAQNNTRNLQKRIRRIDQAQRELLLTPVILDKAQACIKKNDLLTARAQLVYAIMLDRANQRIGQSNGKIRAYALRVLDKLNTELAGVWGKQMPGLQTRLDLVVSNSSISTALSQVATAANITIELLPGSEDDARHILGRERVMIPYLDLRGATVVQALNHILHPFKLDWRLDQDKVIAGSGRRDCQASAWVYDVSLIATPAIKELKNAENSQVLIKTAHNCMNDFLRAAREALHLKGQEIVWYNAGQVLIFGDSATHSAAEKFFANLADPNAKLDRKFAGLHAKTSRRAMERREISERKRLEHESNIIVGILAQHAWRLLSEVADGRADPQSIAWLREAWNMPQITQVLAGKNNVYAFRAVWVLAQATKALPKNKKIAALAVKVKQLARPAITQILVKLKKSPDSETAYLSVLYAAMVYAEEKQFMHQAEPLLLADVPVSQKVLKIIARALLRVEEEQTAGALKKLITSKQTDIHDNDTIVLAAMAARRTGGGLWQAFRRNRGILLGRQRYAGEVVVLLHRLDGYWDW